MQSLRQIGAGLLLGILSVIMVLGGLSLALAQGGWVPASGAPNATGEVIATLQLLPFSFTNTPRGAVLAPTASSTPPATLVNCPPPGGWLPIVIQPNDTLASLAQAYNSTTDALRAGNCLLSDALIANSILYVPAQAIATIKPCGPPAGWDATYTANPADTLYSIGLRYGVQWQALMQANCLETSYIKAGQVLRVPNVQISTEIIPTDTPEITPTIVIISDTATAENTPTDTDTPPAATETETLPAPTETETPSATIEEPSPTTAPSETPIPSEPATTTP